MEKIINKLISEFTKGVDTYTHNGSTWLIFTESKQWVIELTEEKTLWYNYTFFKSVFAYSSLNVVDNQQYITKWVEDHIINKVSDIHFRDVRDRKQQFDDTLENGVKETYLSENSLSKGIEYTIENGIKETNTLKYIGDIDEVLENGVKETLRASYLNVDNVIQDGVKETKYNQSHQEPKFKEVLKNGVKRTFDCDWPVPTDLIEDVINDGVKDTKVCNYTDPETQIMTIKWGHCIDEVIENGVKETIDCDWADPNQIDEVIDNGIKETKTPGEDGDIVGALDFMTEHKTNNFPKLIDCVIDNGVKETKWANKYNHIGPIFKEDKIQEVLEKGIKNPTG